MSLKEIKKLMTPTKEFEDAFREELMACYLQSSQASEIGDDRQVVVKLSQAQVWERLLKLVSGK